MGGGVVQKGGGGGRRRGRRSGGGSRPMAEINVTPFVDVMLVLLIIFMVAAPMMTVGVPLELPKTAAQSMPTEQEEPLTISLTADGGLTIQTTAVSDEELIPRLQSIMTERRSNKLFIRADNGVNYGRVAEVMGALQAAGYTSLGLVTDPNGPRFGATGG
ncbi:protein TolR [Falsigemmobacter intermedius]|uniref:Protein TolR n=1 Tax=Falsigemmobacter intermedius TaxID=1553448 RepID=A0A444M9D1_9RHOB|nr:protein TolR [Falsigemmobacter intermedius]RWY39528.1 protein TolR [Falsigemmobacter intermedius]